MTIPPNRDPYIDEVLQNPGEPAPGRAHPSEDTPPAKPEHPELDPDNPQPPPPEWPDDTVKPEDQSGG
ncbi:hypothetical protein SJI00_21910 [Pseudomonas sp. RP23018S]|uniref:hypothetical protein n=1 Tax=Pseudomonas sp. RP23018S TaxID=3096037 RepID=UPI002ACA2FB0|nr:hypothetical protein [Pseudomonas sp. RP23018S]MDZ5605433.1 hypothetical protein [Pseudomonas sp. RP23018S]